MGRSRSPTAAACAGRTRRRSRRSVRSQRWCRWLPRTTRNDSGQDDRARTRTPHRRSPSSDPIAAACWRSGRPVVRRPGSPCCPRRANPNQRRSPAPDPDGLRDPPADRADQGLGSPQRRVVKTPRWFRRMKCARTLIRFGCRRPGRRLARRRPRRGRRCRAPTGRGLHMSPGQRCDARDPWQWRASDGP